MNDEYLEKALSFSVDTKWESLPAEVIQQAKRNVLDNLGALIAGTQALSAQIARELAVEQFGGSGDQGTILVTGQKSSVSGASWANAVAADALDIDDGHNVSKGHSGSCVLPAVLALSQMAASKKDGKHFLTAIVVANEISIRSSFIRNGVYPTYHPTGSYAGIGVTAAGAVLLGIDKETLYHAMGTAEYHGVIGPMYKGMVKPVMSKDGIGWAAMVGVTSVILAQKKFTGVKPIFSDAPEGTSSDFGTAWEFLKVYYKPYSCCRWAHSTLAATQKVYQQMKENNLGLESIESIQVNTFADSAALQHTAPATTEEAQYNLTYPVAVMLIEGDVSPQHVLPPRIFDKETLDLQSKVSVNILDEYEKEFPNIFLSEVIVKITGIDKEFRSGPTEPKWEPRIQPATDQELTQKFNRIVTPVLGKEKAESIAKMVWDLENLENVEDLIALCVA